MKAFLSVALTCIALGASAQNPGAVKLYGGIGFGQPLRSGVPGGYVLALEPKVVISPNFDIGILIEAAQLSRSVTTVGGTYSTNSRIWSSYRVTGNYWLKEKKFRSFVGVGAGLFHLPATNGITVIDNQSPNTILFPDNDRFGGMIRYGFKMDHFLATVEYNMALSSTLYLSATPVKSPNSYLSLKIGYEVGGFKKKAAVAK